MLYTCTSHSKFLYLHDCVCPLLLIHEYMNICVFVFCQSCPTPGLSFKQLMKIATLQFLEVNQIPSGSFGKFSCHLICRSIADVEFTAIDATIIQHIQQVGATHCNCRWIISGYEAAATLHCSNTCLTINCWSCL